MAAEGAMQCPACGAEIAGNAAVCPACSAPLPAVAPGTLLAGRYEIQALLGAGALGRVYRALDRTLNEAVAVKVLHPETTRSAEITRRFRNEIKLARRVRHVNVCAIHEYGEEGPLQYVAMELVDGADLQRVLRERGPLPPAEVLEVALQVVRGLAAIHDAGVIHRDLKTSNIVRDRSGAVRLLDFGIAKRRTPTGTLALTNVERVVGTPEYMSPEQIRGDELDPRSDIYSFGVVLFELSTGTLPFEGKTPLDTMLRQVNEPPPLYGDRAARIPPALVPLLRRVLSKDPAGRPASARELEAELLFAAVPDASAEPAAATDAPPEPPSPTPPPLPTPPLTPPAPVPPPLVPPPLPAAAEPRGGAERVDRTEVLPRRPGARRPTPPPPPVVVARDAAAAAALDSERTYIELPAAPEAQGPALHPPPLPPKAAAPPPLPRAARRAWLVPAVSGIAVLLLALALRSWLAPGHENAPPAPLPTPEAIAPNVAEPPSPVPQPTATPRPKPPPPSPTPAPTPRPTPATPAPTVRPPTPPPTPEPTPTVAAVLAPTPTPVPRALLAISARPWASVEIDGKPYGRTPLPGILVEPGEHEVDLVNPEYWPRRRRVVLLPGSTFRLDVDLPWEGVRRSPTVPGRLPQGASPPDPELDRGENQLRDMQWQDAIVTLEAVVRRLRTQPRQKSALARAYFYLGVAHLELEETIAATTSFLAALEQDGRLRPPPAAFSPRVLGFFEHVRNTAREKP
jgi:eukaryotic-like serine/threonine-protein kinase